MHSLPDGFLPTGMSFEDIKWLVAPELWDSDFTKAAILAFRRSGRIDVEAYLSAYPDVRYANVSPEEHYVRNGFKEGRKIKLLANKCSNQKADNEVKTQRETSAMEYELEQLRKENIFLLEHLHLAQEELERYKKSLSLLA